MHKIKKLFLLEVPLFAVVLFCALSAYVAIYLSDTLNPKNTGKYLVAEKSAIILQAVFERQGDSQEDLEKEVAAPIIAVLKKYADAGYVVIDTAKDEQGNLSISAMPDGTRDISAELRTAIKKKVQ